MSARETCRTAPMAVTTVLAIVAAMPAPPAAAAGQGIGELRAVVDAACDCAAGHDRGLRAALECTTGPREFGRLKVAHRGAWSDTEREAAARLERIIEYCIANAMSADDARDLLGLPAPPVDAAVPLMRWRRIPPAELGDHDTRLVRIDDGRGETVKGLVETVSGDRVWLRRSRRDGGGIESLPLEAIRGAWIMELN